MKRIELNNICSIYEEHMCVYNHNYLCKSPITCDGETGIKMDNSTGM